MGTIYRTPEGHVEEIPAEWWAAELAGRDRKLEELGRDLALAESRIEQLERQLIAVGALDPKLGP